MNVELGAQITTSVLSELGDYKTPAQLDGTAHGSVLSVTEHCAPVQTGCEAAEAWVG